MRVTDVPAQMVGLLGLTLTTGVARTFTATWAMLVQPAAEVAVTV